MRRLRCSAVFSILVVLALANGLATAGDSIGRKIDDFSLKSQFGKEYSLRDSQQDVVIVVFVGAECPLAKLYGPRLGELSRKLADRGVAVLGIDSNQQDSLQEIAAYAQRHKIE